MPKYHVQRDGQNNITLVPDEAEGEEIVIPAAFMGDLVVVDAGADANAVRPAAPAVYWKCDNGVTPVNAQDGDLIFNADA